MNKYEVLKSALAKGEESSMKCYGNSMLPILTNPSLCRYRKQDAYAVCDIVFCKVKGRYVDAHKITAVKGDQYLISNNHNFNNGWTKAIFGRVFEAVLKDGTVRSFGG